MEKENNNRWGFTGSLFPSKYSYPEEEKILLLECATLSHQIENKEFLSVRQGARCAATAHTS